MQRSRGKKGGGALRSHSILAPIAQPDNGLGPWDGAGVSRSTALERRDSRESSPQAMDWPLGVWGWRLIFVSSNVQRFDTP